MTSPKLFRYSRIVAFAILAQLAEHVTCNLGVPGSIPGDGSRGFDALFGEIPEWSKGADCKSVGLRLRRFKSFSPHSLLVVEGAFLSVDWRSYRGGYLLHV